MKRLCTALIFFVIASCGDSEAPLPKLPDDALILAFGDSLTRGVGANETENYPAVLQRLSGRTVINAGVSGEQSAAGLKRLPALLEKHQPQFLILCHGGNDLLRQKSTSDMKSNLLAMIQLAKDKNIPVMLLGVPKPGLFLSSFEVYEQLADETGVIFIEDLVPNILGDNGLKSDAVHPNKAGYQMMAETIYTALQELGAL